MSFFYNLNQKLAALAAKQDATQLAESKQAETVAQSPLTQALNEGQAKRLPGLPITQKDVEKKFGGSMIKMAQAAKEAGFSDARIKQAMDDLKQGKNPNDIDEADYSAKKAAAGKDIGKPGKNFSKIAKGAAERYGSKAAGERVAGAVLNKLRHANEATDEWSDETPWTDIPKSKTGKPVNPRGEVAHMSDVAQRQSAGIPTTPKQKSFAKLAPPKDKITFADKIAGAKEEVDEMLGDVAAEAMKKAVSKIADEGNAFTGKLKSTPKGGKFKMGNKTMTDTSEVDEGYAEMDAWMASRKKEKGTGKFDKKERTLPSGMKATTYTRKHEDDEEDRDDSKDKQADKYASPKKKGRPKSAAPKDAERVTKGSHKYKTVNGKRVEKDRPAKTAEGLDSDSVMMTRPTNCSSEGAADKSALKSAIALLKKNGYNISKKEVTDEIAPPGAKAERMVKGIKKSLSKDGNLSAKDKAIAYATTWKAKKAGKVEEESADKEEKVKESNKGGYDFGGGVYESFNSKVENMITEGMNVSVNMSTGDDGQPTKSINISADGEDADKLAELLKMAGIESQPGAQAACDQEVVDENSPDWPTNTETLAAQPELRTYSGGLNGPKSTGQTTIPVVASQLRRQASMEESVKLERSLFKTWKDYKG